MFGYNGRSIPGHDPSLKTTGGLMYYHYDGMLSVSELTNRHGDIIERYRYDAFGGIMTGITAPYNTNTYTGHTYDQDAGLIDMRARVYDANVGRFLQEDTYAGTMQNPLSQNRYAYVMNNPVNYWDPTGRVPEHIPDKLGEESFTEAIDRGNHHEIWYYELQYYNSNTTTENYRKTVNEREIIITWTELTHNVWNYFIEHRLNRSEEGALQPVDGRSGYRSFITTTSKDVRNTISAEQLMIANYEELLRYGTPSSREVIFSESKSFTYTRDDIIRVFETGKKQINTMVQIMVAYNSNLDDPKENFFKRAGKSVGNTLKNTAEGIIDAGKKTWDSSKIIVTSFYGGLLERSENKFNSPRDFANYITLGMSEGLIDRAEKSGESVYDFGNWITLGLVETVDHALFPEEAFSPEHLLNSFALATVGYGGTILKPQTNALVPNTKNINVAAGNISETTPINQLKSDLQFFGKKGVSKLEELSSLAKNYRLSDEFFESKILTHHGPNSSTFLTKNKFSSSFDIRKGIDDTLRGSDTLILPNTGGRSGYIFIKKYSSPIGYNKRGKPQYDLKVVLDENGNVTTAFPTNYTP